jgi:hypothetical protein
MVCVPPQVGVEVMNTLESNPTVAGIPPRVLEVCGFRKEVGDKWTLRL